MKAIVYEKHGSPDVLVFREIDKPELRDGEVLIRIHAASANALDYRPLQMKMVPKGKILGADIAGRVEAIGSDCRHFQPGDAVVGDISDCGSGGFAEYVAVPEKAIVRKPAGVSFEDAAAVPVAAVTALQALRDKGKIQPGQQVLIVGAGGGVGTFTVQLAKHFGAEVTAVCSARNMERVRALGADHVMDYTQENLARIGNRYDRIMAINGHHAISAYKRILKPEGICVVVGGRLTQIATAIFIGPLLSMGGKKIRILAARSNSKDLEFLMGLVESGQIKPAIDKRYPLSEAADALRYIGLGHAQGKVVITVIPET